MVPEVGLEPTWALSPPDFESGAYTNFATPAEVSMIRGLNKVGQELYRSGSSVFFRAFGVFCRPGLRAQLGKAPRTG